MNLPRPRRQLRQRFHALGELRDGVQLDFLYGNLPFPQRAVPAFERSCCSELTACPQKVFNCAAIAFT